MSEHLNTPSQENIKVIDRKLADAFNNLPDDVLLDRKFMIETPDGQTEVSVEDFGRKYEIDEAGNRTGEKYPIIRLKDETGNVTEVPTEEFLSRTLLSADEITNMISDETSKGEKSETLYKPIQETEIVSPKEDYEPRLSQLFSPVKDETRPEVVEDYDSWFDKDNEVFDPSIDSQTQIESAANRLPANERLRVTPESQKMAEKRLEIAGDGDPNLKLIFDKYSPKGTNLSDLLRNDEDFRTDVGVYLLHKLNNLAINEKTIGQQIKDNSEKSPATTGYSHIPELRSREYATLLAISMLDGTFKDELVQSNTIEYADDGEVLLGQHRAAANELLGLK